MEGFERRKSNNVEDKVIEEGEWNFKGETTAMWNQMTNYIRKVAKEVLGESEKKKPLVESGGLSGHLREKALLSLAED